MYVFEYLCIVHMYVRIHISSQIVFKWSTLNDRRINCFGVGRVHFTLTFCVLSLINIIEGTVHPQHQEFSHMYISSPTNPGNFPESSIDFSKISGKFSITFSEISISFWKYLGNPRDISRKISRNFLIPHSSPSRQPIVTVYYVLMSVVFLRYISTTTENWSPKTIIR